MKSLFSRFFIVIAVLGIAVTAAETTASAATNQRVGTGVAHSNGVLAAIKVSDVGPSQYAGFERIRLRGVVVSKTEGYLGLASGENGEGPAASYGATHFGAGITFVDIVVEWNTSSPICTLIVENAQRQQIASASLHSC